MEKLNVNIDRIKKDLEKILSFNAGTKGYTRFSYSLEDRQTREYLINIFHDLGLSVSVDGAGNIRARYGEGEQPIVSGSHIDTVPNGGKYDGLIGVLCAIETARVLIDNNIKGKHPYEVIIFAEEEGSNFGTTMLGSKILTGVLSKEDLYKLKNNNGKTAFDVIKDFGLNVDSIGNQSIKDERIKAMIELHIEQGGILDAKRKSIGIVHKIAGMNTIQVLIKGISNHAGSTPMNMRKDPLICASEIILKINDYVSSYKFKTAVATIGHLEATPSASNVINSKVCFHVDIRDVEENSIKDISDFLEKEVKETCEKRGLTYEIDLLGASKPYALSDKIISSLKDCAKQSEIDYIDINSGAVHDSAMLIPLTDVGMIFVPSIGGLSHCPQEDTDIKDIETGANLLLQSVIKLIK